ncbi:MAG: 3-deoxy-7-phosphoheptulonate synthase [Bacteriovoracaceae bacterium]|nr:3-deoxy-7-phosphoheptulonate synthase [Bacteriovoracaceae bacterium]
MSTKSQDASARLNLTSRAYQKQDSIIDVEGIKIGGGSGPVIIGGPCSVESEKQIIETAEIVKHCGGHMLRGGAFKARTSPYSFQGLGEAGLKYLQKAKTVTGLPIVTEVVAPNDVPLVAEYADIIQIGCRNMQNYALLKECGKSRRPVILKRGFGSSIPEFILAAEYIMSEGNLNVILCERGIRTFCQEMRFTLDIGAVPLLKERTHLPIIVDPSHAAGKYRYVNSLSQAAIAVGADGLLIEVHYKPETSTCDPDQAISEDIFFPLVQNVNKIYNVLNTNIM